MKTSASVELSIAMLEAINCVRESGSTITYDDVWEATAVLIANTLSLTPSVAHDAAVRDLFTRVAAILNEYNLDHPRRDIQ